MSRPPKTFHVRLPPYAKHGWREDILAAARKKLPDGVRYAKSDRLQLNVRLYLVGRELERVDVDNSLRRIVDALQGQFGGKGGKNMDPKRPRIIRNERQVWSATIEKVERSRKLAATAGGHLIISHLKAKRG
jgi:hypothetical protein